MCLHTPHQLAEIEVEACILIESEPNLLVIGKVVAFIEIDKDSNELLSVTRVEGWKDTPHEKFVWMQSNENTKTCALIEEQEPFLARMDRPCCDVVTYIITPDGKETRADKFSCIHELREISEIQYR